MRFASALRRKCREREIRSRKLASKKARFPIHRHPTTTNSFRSASVATHVRADSLPCTKLNYCSRMYL